MKLGPYTSILATSSHQVIRDLNLLRKSRYESQMGFFLNGLVIGSGYLRCEGSSAVRTDGTGLNKDQRGRGHGIHLYVHLIAQAQAIGASRVYSSWRLNKFSRRIWKVKLAKFFEVKTSKTRSRCRRCGFSNPKERYYIQIWGSDLNMKKIAREILNGRSRS